MQVYVNTMSAEELLKYFLSTENYTKKSGKAMSGFMPDWIGEFYAYYQWYEKVLENPQVIKTPVVRNGKQSTLGYQPDDRKGWS